MLDQLVAHKGVLKIHDEKPAAYLICHEATGKVYVGSAGKPGQRISRHKTLLKGNRHDNSVFQQLYNESDRLRQVVYPVVDREFAYRLEQALVDYYSEQGLLINIGLDVRAANRGRTASPETLAKMSAARLGVKLSEETRRKISEGALAAGWTRTPEQREHLSALKKGKPQPVHIQELLHARNAARARHVSIDGRVFEGIRVAARELNVDRRVIGRRLNSTDPLWATWFFT